MIAAVDTAYDDATHTGCVALVIAEDDRGERIVEVRTVFLTDVAPYEPGNFAAREMPGILRVLQGAPVLDVLYVDAYAWLGPDRTGLGERLRVATRGSVPIVGIAKTAFSGMTKGWRTCVWTLRDRVVGDEDARQDLLARFPRIEREDGLLDSLEKGIVKKNLWRVQIQDSFPATGTWSTHPRPYDTTSVVRGERAASPLFVSTAGCDLEEAAERVRELFGSARIPEICRRADLESRAGLSHATNGVRIEREPG